MTEEIECEGKLVLESKRVSKNGKKFQVWRCGEQSFTVFNGNETPLEETEGKNVKIKLVHDGKFIRYEKGSIILLNEPILRAAALKPSLSQDAAVYQECMEVARKILQTTHPLQQTTTADILNVTRDLFIYRKQRD